MNDGQYNASPSHARPRTGCWIRVSDTHTADPCPCGLWPQYWALVRRECRLASSLDLMSDDGDLWPRGACCGLHKQPQRVSVRRPRGSAVRADAIDGR